MTSTTEQRPSRPSTATGSCPSCSGPSTRSAPPSTPPSSWSATSSATTGPWPTRGPLTAAELAGGHRHRRALRPGVAQRAGGRARSWTTTPRQPATRSPPSTPSPSPTSRARRSCPGCSRSPSAPSRDAGRIPDAARRGTGVGWHEHNRDVHHGCERFFRPGYHAHLVEEWLPAVGCRRPASRGRVRRRRRVRPRRLHGADGRGLPGLALPSARTTTRSRSRSPGRAPSRPAWPTGSPSRWRPPTGSPGPGSTSSRPSTPSTTWATRWAPRATSTTSLADDGIWMVVEPMAGDRVEDNLNPVGPDLLRLLDAAVHPGLAVPGRRPRARAPRPGRPGSARSPRPRASRSSAAPRRRRSTGSWRSGGSQSRDRRVGATDAQ